MSIMISALSLTEKKSYKEKFGKFLSRFASVKPSRFPEVSILVTDELRGHHWIHCVLSPNTSRTFPKMLSF